MAGQVQDQDMWSGLLNSPLGGNAAAQGAMALQSGAVDPEDAANKIHPVLKAAGFGANKKSVLLALKKIASSGPKNAPSPGTPSAFAGNMPGGPMAVPPGQPGNDVAALASTSLPQAEVDPVPKGSGLTREQQFTQSMLENIKNQDRQDTKTFQFMDPTQVGDLYKQTAALPSFQEQQHGLDQQREIAKLAATAPTDIYSKPLAGLLQAEFGRNTSGMTAAAGESPEQQRTQLLNMSEKSQDDQRDLSKSIFDAIGKEKSGQLDNTLLAMAALQNGNKSLSQANAVDPNKFVKGTNSTDMKLKIFNAFQKEAGDDKKALEQSQNAINTLQSGSFVGDKAVQALLARASSEVGRLSTYEQQMFTGSPALAAQLNRAITKADSGRLDETDRNDMLLLARTYEQFRKDSLGKKVDYFSTQVGPSLGQEPGAMSNMLMPKGGFGLPSNKVGTKPLPKAGSPAAANDPPVAVIMSNGVKGKIPTSQLKQFLADGAGKVAP